MVRPERLTAFQVDLAGIFFSLDAAKSYLVAGGAALVASELVDRPTQMIRTLNRFDVEEIPLAPDQIPRLRSFFTRWANELR